jgi:hypothetical protein
LPLLSAGTGASLEQDPQEHPCRFRCEHWRLGRHVDANPACLRARRAPDDAGSDFRHEARQEWRRLLSRRYVYSQLSDWEKRSFAWDQLVTMWQVIGRLVRGGVPARVVFVDAKFAPETAAKLTPGTRTSAAPAHDGLLAQLHDILTPYFDPNADPARFNDPADPALARLLYEPLYDALCGLTHRT